MIIPHRYPVRAGDRHREKQPIAATPRLSASNFISPVLTVYYLEEFQATSIGEINHGTVLDLSAPFGREDVYQLPQKTSPNGQLGGYSSMPWAYGR